MRHTPPASTPQPSAGSSPGVDPGDLVARAFVQDAAPYFSWSERDQALDRPRPFMYGVRGHLSHVESLQRRCGILGSVNDDESQRSEYMHGWRWEDPRWREWTGSDAAKLLLEALRRAVDIRDTNAQGIALAARPLVLLDVLNALSASLGVSGSDIWDASGPWDAARFTHDDEDAFWKRHNKS
jgi:hypothetical protein